MSNSAPVHNRLPKDAQNDSAVAWSWPEVAPECVVQNGLANGGIEQQRKQPPWPVVLVDAEHPSQAEPKVGFRSEPDVAHHLPQASKRPGSCGQPQETKWPVLGDRSLEATVAIFRSAPRSAHSVLVLYSCSSHAIALF